MTGTALKPATVAKPDGNAFVAIRSRRRCHRSHATGRYFQLRHLRRVGQGTNTFLKAGDVVETEIELLGRMRHRFVAEA